MQATLQECLDSLLDQAREGVFRRGTRRFLDRIKYSLATRECSLFALRASELTRFSLEDRLQDLPNYTRFGKTISIIIAGGSALRPVHAIDAHSMAYWDSIDLDSPIIQDGASLSTAEFLGLVLGGGGAKVAAQAGAIKALTEKLQELHGSGRKPEISYIVGSSIRAFNGMFVSANLIGALESFWTTVQPFTALTIWRTTRRFKVEKLSIPLEVTKMSLQTGLTRYLSRATAVSFWREVRASMRVPGLLRPSRFEHQQYVDGGVINNLPIGRCISNRCDWIVFIDLENVGVTDRWIFGPIRQALRASSLQGQALARYQRAILQACNDLTRLAELPESDARTVSDVELIGKVKRECSVLNVLPIRLGSCTTARSFWFSRRRCSEDFNAAYHYTMELLDAVLEHQSGNS